MDLTSFGFLALMVLIGGVVAYIADNLGRTLGKKRLTLFHMRPRHTATAMTVGAGMLIPFITVLLVAVVSSDVRVWIAEGRRAIHERDEAIKARDRVVEERELAVEQRDRARNDRDKVRQDVARLEGDLKKNQIELQKGRSELADVRAQLKTASDEVKRAKAQIVSLEEQVKDKNADLKEVGANLLLAQQQLGTAQNKYDKALASYEQQQKRLNEQFEYNRRLMDDNERLDKVNANVSAELQLKQDQLANVRTQLDQQNRELELVSARLARIEDFAGRNLDISRRKKLVVGLGHELARLQVPAGLREQEAKSYLSSLLIEAGRVAQDRGAKPAEGGLPSAGLFPRTDTDNRTITPEEQENAIAKGMAGSRDDIVLVARALLNSFQGERVPLEVVAYRNPLVYKRGQAVAEVRIDGSHTDEDVLRDISEFLRTKVREQALRDRMIPLGDADGELGVVEPDDIIQLVRSIREQSRMVRLVAYAGQDTRAADPLRLEFRIR